MTDKNDGYRVTASGPWITLEAVAELVKEGKIDLSNVVAGPGNRKALLAEHPAIVDRLLQSPGEIDAEEFRQRLDDEQCLHCHRKGAALHERRRVAGFLWLSWLGSGLDFVCSRCRGQAIYSDIFSTTWCGWWGYPAMRHAAGIVLGGVRGLTGAGSTVGVVRGLVGLGFVLTPFMAILLVYALFIHPHQGSLSDEERAAAAVADGKRQIEEHRFESAAGRFQEAARLIPDWSEPYYWLGCSRFEMADYAGALQAIRKACELAAHEETDQVKEKEYLWLHTLAAHRAGMTDEATRAIRRFLSLTPGELPQHRFYQSLMIQSGHRSEVIDEYREKIEALGPEAAARDHYLLASVMGDPEMGQAAIEKALAIDGEHVPSLLFSANCLGRLGRWEESRQRALESRAVHDRAESYSLEADALTALGRDTEAWEAISKGVDLHPGSRYLRLKQVYKALALEGEDRFDLARKVALAGKARGRDDPAWVVDFDIRHAIVEREAGGFEEASSMLARITRITGIPEEAIHEAWLEHVFTLLEAGQLEKAVREAPGAREEFDGDPERRLRMDLWVGAALVELGRPDEARALWEESLEDAGGEVGEIDPSPQAAMEFLLARDVTAETIKAFRMKTVELESPSLVNNVDLIVGLARFLAGDEPGAREMFQASATGSRGHNFPYFSARRWLEKAR